MSSHLKVRLLLWCGASNASETLWKQAVSLFIAAKFCLTSSELGSEVTPPKGTLRWPLLLLPSASVFTLASRAETSYCCWSNKSRLVNTHYYCLTLGWGAMLVGGGCLGGWGLARHHVEQMVRVFLLIYFIEASFHKKKKINSVK